MTPAVDDIDQSASHLEASEVDRSSDVSFVAHNTAGNGARRALDGWSPSQPHPADQHTLTTTDVLG